MLSPKKTKFRKYHRGRMKGKIFLRFFVLRIA
jgi:ribosomal protein L16/L10AE